ncbi:unnamed protein product, partial [Effrenium voratum]
QAWPAPAPAKTTEAKDVAQLEAQCEDLRRALVEARQQAAVCGAAERRLREALRSRSACLVRLASHLTRAQDSRRADSGEQREGCDAEAQTEPQAAAKLAELAGSSPELREQVLRKLRAATAAGW